MEGNRTMTDTDVQAIVTALQVSNSHCRYEVSPDEMKDMMRFVKNWNRALEEGKNTIGKTILVLTISALFALLGLGVWAKTKGV